MDAVQDIFNKGISQITNKHQEALCELHDIFRAQGERIERLEEQVRQLQEGEGK